MALTAFDFEDALRALAADHPTGRLHVYCGPDELDFLDRLLHPGINPPGEEFILRATRIKFRFGSIDVHPAAWVAPGNFVLTDAPIVGVIPERRDEASRLSG